MGENAMRILTIGNALSIGGVAALFAGCGGSQFPAAMSPSGASRFAYAHHITFQYTGKKQTFKVPSGVTHIQVVAVAGSGAGTRIAHGGRVSAVIPVMPSETLAIYVGGASTSLEGGFNGGARGGQLESTGYAGYGGGGASDVREGGDGAKDRIVVAGGGGGEGFAPRGDSRRDDGYGGQGGARTGGSGKEGCCKRAGNGGNGGTGGTQTQGGSAGKGGTEYPAEPGRLGYGGVGGSGCGTSSCGYNGGSGGGGGGGYYGGGGGGGGVFFGCCGTGGGGGGGGGSSYVENTASNVHFWRGWKNATSNGFVVFSW
jgi:hypothetical protein